jgi:hypothetical protein
LSVVATGSRADTPSGAASVPPPPQPSSFYPAAALAAHVGGFADLTCNRTKQGGFTGCQTNFEWPRGEGFARAALALAAGEAECPDATIPWAGRGAGEVVFNFSLQPRGNPDQLQPTWTMIRILRRPTAYRLSVSYPDRAASEHVGGHVTLTCAVTGKGGLDHCKISDEAPPAYRFGISALSLASDFTVAVGGPCDRLHTGDEVRIPVEWNWTSNQLGRDFGDDLGRDMLRNFQR